MDSQRKVVFALEWAIDNFLGLLNSRSRLIIENRFGIGTNSEPQTLESIGEGYSITRERVRQIEQDALRAIKQSEEYKSGQNTEKTLKTVFEEKGRLLTEKELLESISDDKKIQNKILFFITLNDGFIKWKEDEDCFPHWSIDRELSCKVHSAIERLYSELPNDKLFDENEIIYRFLKVLETECVAFKPKEITLRWLALTKNVLKNPLGEWGKDTANGVRVSGVKDYAYLALKKNGIPMHFNEIAKAIKTMFNVPCNTATCHNELIKDDRIVLVGRGTYALSENGYTPGFARDVIKELLEKEGPLGKDEIVSKVLEKRTLQKNTVLAALQDPACFKKDAQKKYSPVAIEV